MTQLNIIDAIAEMEAGIQQAVDNADKKNEGWSMMALDLLSEFVRVRSTSFRCEEFREWCAGKLPAPPHDRAFGGVIRAASKRGMIKFDGYDKTENPKAHRAHCALWRPIKGIVK